MEAGHVHPERLRVPHSGPKRFVAGIARAFLRRCPYCGSSDVFTGWFTLKHRCPYCGVVYAYETGYFLGAYAVNLMITELVAAAIVISLIVFTDLSVLQMQGAAVAIAVGLPILGYPISLLIWVAVDLTFNPPNPQTGARTH